ncbi:hypothetical protein NQZ68_009213 [Dissostichus eleginoides]|nr:hypothetical protein NQZ68_009213 [Dissostichus eleginoides]
MAFSASETVSAADFYSVPSVPCGTLFHSTSVALSCRNWGCIDSNKAGVGDEPAMGHFSVEQKKFIRNVTSISLCTLLNSSVHPTVSLLSQLE